MATAGPAAPARAVPSARCSARSTAAPARWTVIRPRATAGAGGAAGAGGSHGGTGGNGQGGGILATFGVTATLSDTDLLQNQATGGAGAAGGNGGNGQGGGIFVDGASPFGTPDVALTG